MVNCDKVKMQTENTTATIIKFLKGVQTKRED